MASTRTAALILATGMLGTTAGGQDAPVAPMSPRLAELVKQLKDPDWDTRMEAATALGVMRAEAKPAIPSLVEALKDPVAPVRMKAIDALMFMGTEAAEAVPRIVPFLSDPDELVRVSAVVALPRVAPDRASVLPLLKKALDDKAWRVRRQAAIELIHLDAEVPAAIPVLREGVKDAIPTYRLGAIAALGRAVSPEERKAMAVIAAEYLRVSDADVQHEAIRALSSLGADAVPYLVGLIKTEGEGYGVRMSAIRALGRIGPDAKAALPLLRELQQRKGMWLKTAQKSAAAIEGKEPPLPEEVTGPVPPLNAPSDEPGAPRPARPGAPTPSPPPEH